MIKKNFKLIIAIILVMLVTGYLTSKDQLPQPMMYFFSDIDDHNVIVKGTWFSDTKLSSKIQSSYIQCHKPHGYCVESNAQITSHNMLWVEPTWWKIEQWTPEEIVCSDNNPTCVTYALHIDRKNKTVTSITNTKKPKPDGCEGIRDESIFMHLI